jgi:hypothetical protein
MKIFRQDTYKDEAGRMLTVFTQTDELGSKAPLFVPEMQFLGQAQVNFPNGASAMMQFPIQDATTIRQAFERFDACAELAAKKKVEEMQRQAIKQALQMPAQLPKKNGRILGLNG